MQGEQENPLQRDSPFRNKCYECKHMGELPGNAHIACLNPIVHKAVAANPVELFIEWMDNKMVVSLAEQMGVTGNEHGIKNLWFRWPVNFDPIWLTGCNNFEPKGGE